MDILIKGECPRDLAHIFLPICPGLPWDHSPGSIGQPCRMKLFIAWLYQCLHSLGGSVHRSSQLAFVLSMVPLTLRKTVCGFLSCFIVFSPWNLKLCFSLRVKEWKLEQHILTGHSYYAQPRSLTQTTGDESRKTPQQSNAWKPQ